MIPEFTLRLHFAGGVSAETECLSLMIEREAYTPYEQMTATFLLRTELTEQIASISLLWRNEMIFRGLTDLVEQSHSGGGTLVKVKSRSYTSLLTQNELEPGLYGDVTIRKLITGFYTFPYISYESPEDTGYIFVKSGSSLWDAVVNFGYKLKEHYPYIRGNRVCLSAPAGDRLVTIDSGQVLSYGSVQDTTRLVSHYHMEDILETPNVYRQENPAAVGANIVRHKQIPFDRQYMYQPDQALTFRNRYSRRGSFADYVEYVGFFNESVGDRVTCGSYLQAATVCRVRAVYSGTGMRTKLWCYRDGFYGK